MTCTAVNRTELDALAPGRVELVRHGLDLDEFPPPPAPARAEGEPPVLTILSVGRAVEKKGYPDLIAALARLPAEPAWRFVHVGGGPLIESVRGLAERAGIAGRTEWVGAIARPELLARLRAADLFVLACRVARDGDRDGLPNVLLEAQSQGLPCVATRVSAIPELIEDGVTGLLCPPGNPEALAAAIQRLLRDRGLRRRLGAAGEHRVRAEFSSVAGADRLAAKFRALLGRPAPAGEGIAPHGRPTASGAAVGRTDAPLDASTNPDPEAGAGAGAAGARLSATEAEAETGPASGEARGERAADRAA